MATLEKRIEALEQTAVKPEELNYTVVFAGESTEAATAGYAPDERVICVRFVEAAHGHN